MRFLHIFLTICTSSTTLVTALPTRSSTSSSQDTRTTSNQRPRDPPIVIAPPGLSKKKRKVYRDKVHEDYNGLSFGDEASHATFASVVDPWHKDGDDKLRATFHYRSGRMANNDNIIGDPARPRPIYKAFAATSNRERLKREGDVVGHKRGRHARSHEAPSPVGQVRGGGDVGSSSRTGIEDVRLPKQRMKDIRQLQREVGRPPYEHAVKPEKLVVWLRDTLKMENEHPDLLKKVHEHYGMLPASDPSRAAVAVKILKGFHIDDSEDKKEHATVRYYYPIKEKYRTTPGVYHVYKDGPAYRPSPSGP